MYLKQVPLAQFGAWYDGISFDRALTAAWARRLDPSLPSDDNALIARIAQPLAAGGGFVAGGQRMCLSNRRGGPTEPMRSADQPCPPGSGGVPGEQVQEISAEEVRRQIEEQRAREEAERTQPAVPVEVTGSVQMTGPQVLRSVTITTGMTGSTHPVFGEGTGGEPPPVEFLVEVEGQSGRTDAQGRFTIRAQAPGVVAGRVVDGVGKVRNTVLVVIGEGSAVTNSLGQFRIPLHVSELRGRVVDGSGRAVGGATVEIEADPASRSGRFDAGYFMPVPMSTGTRWELLYGIPYSVRSSAYVAASARTNAAGIFSVKVPTGNYSVKIRASGFQDRKLGGVRVAVGATKDTGNIVLIPAIGAPLPGGTPGGAPGGTSDGTPGGTPKEETGIAPWYKSTWFWVGTAAVAVGGVGYLIWRQRKGR